MRILFSTCSAPQYMAPPVLSDEQVNCGPFFPEVIIDGRVFSLTTPKGEYDLAALAARLPEEQQPDVVVCLVDSSWYSVPKNLAAFKCPKVALIADTHHMAQPLVGMIKYLRTELFDRNIFLYTRHHLELFRAAHVPNLAWLPGLTFPHRDDVVQGYRRADRAKSIALIGQSSHLYRRRLAMAGAVARAGLPLNFREGSQRDSLECYGRSLIGLNATANADLNLRAIEITASGAMMLMDRLAPESGISSLWQEGREYVGFESAEELVRHACYYLDKPEEAARIGANGARWFDQQLNATRRRQLFDQLVHDGREDPLFALPAPSKFVRSPFGGNTVRYVAGLAVLEHIQKLHSATEIVRVQVDKTVPADFLTLCQTLPRVRVTSDPAETESPDYLVISAARRGEYWGRSFPRIWFWDADTAHLAQITEEAAAAGMSLLREGVAFYGLAVAEAQPPVDRLAMQARQKLQVCDAGAAFALARQAFEQHSDSLEAILVIAEVALENGKTDLFAKMLRAAEKAAPDDARAALLGLAARQPGARQSPADRMLSVATRHMGDAQLVAAHDLATRACKLEPTLPAAWFWLGHISIRLARQKIGAERLELRAAGRAALRQAMQLAPARADIVAELAHSLWEDGQLADASEAFDKAVAIEPLEAGYWNSWARVLLAGGDADRAVEILMRAVDMHPTNSALKELLERAALPPAPQAPSASRGNGTGLKILFISSEFPPDTGFGGIGTYVAHVAQALVARGNQVTVLSRSISGADTESTIDGVRVVRLVTRQAPAEFWHEPFDGQAAARAREHYDRAYTVALALQADPSLRADIIEAADWAGEAAMVRAVCPDTPYIVKFHTPAKLVFGWNGAGVSGDFVNALHALENVAVSNASGFTSPSRWLAPQVEKLFGLDDGTVEVVANPYVPQGACASPRKANRSVLYVGRLEARKGIMEAIEPMVRLLRSLPDVRWRLAGADTQSGPGGSSMRTAVLERMPSDVRGRVDMLGPLNREQLSVELASAGVVLLPSRKENFPYACLEAMAAGAPVVGSLNGGMAEMITQGRTGLLVDPAQSESVYDATLRVLEQPFFAGALGAAGSESVLTNYRPEVVAPLVENHYRRVIANFKPSP